MWIKGVFPYLGKSIAPTLKDKKVTYSISSFKPRFEKLFLVAKTLKDITTHSLNLEKVFSQEPAHLKQVPHIIAVQNIKKFVSPYADKKNL